MPRVTALPAAELMLIVGNLIRSGVAQRRAHRDGAIESALRQHKNGDAVNVKTIIAATAVAAASIGSLAACGSSHAVTPSQASSQAASAASAAASRSQRSTRSR